MLAAGVALAALGVAGMGDIPLLGTIGWLGGLGLCSSVSSIGCHVLRRVLTAALATGGPITGIIAAAAFLRLHQLADLPVEAGCIPLKLEIVRGILAGERRSAAVFPGREVGFFYVTALYGAVFGADQFSLKRVGGVQRRHRRRPTPARAAWPRRRFVAAAALAVSAWHLTISRGYRGVLTPLVVAAAMLMLDRALARGAAIGRCWEWSSAPASHPTAALAIPFAVAGVCVATAAHRWAGWAAAPRRGRRRAAARAPGAGSSSACARSRISESRRH